MAQGARPKMTRVTVRFTVEQFNIIDERAERRGVPTAAYIRSVALQAATRKITSEGYLRIREPDGVTA